MTLLFIDGCASYSAINACMDKWDYISDDNMIAFAQVSDLRSGAYANQIKFLSHQIIKTLNSEKQTIIVGMSYKKYDVVNGNPIKFYLNTTVQITFTFDADGTINARRGSESGTILASSVSGIVTLDNWQYYEFKVVIDGSTGSVECRVNGISILSATNI